MESRDQTNRQLKKASAYSNVEKKHSSPSVIVIGGGFAGISAARALHDASFQVTLLESRDRLGGRVYTDYSFGFPVDLGASCYALFDKDGKQVPQELVTKIGEVFEKILEELTASTLTAQPALITFYGWFYWDSHMGTDKLREECIEDMSIQQAFGIVLDRRPDLRQEGLAHKVLQWYLCRMEGWFAADSDTISLKGWDQASCLPFLLVTKISRRYNGVKVTTEDGKIFAADAAVVAVPLGVLRAKHISFEPRLPEWKEKAIADLGIGIENKVALHFDKVFWPNVEFLGVVASTSYGCSYFLNLHKATGHPVLVYMPAGRLAVDIQKMSDEAAANFAFLQLKTILPEASEPIQYLVSHWGSDVNSLGSYSYDAVGKPHDLYERLRIPVDNIFFAGEATSSIYPGTVHGAYSTGQMAAEDCRMRVLERYGELDLFNPVMGEEMASVSVPLLISRMLLPIKARLIPHGLKRHPNTNQNVEGKWYNASNQTYHLYLSY
ncbi:hypothetical protein Syun_028261 [Stephania yunnanensis]|uniref:Amine oxidase domain-containing protein n=1 Tax=Stephania yunnanensis TaxID=152371 RepID=A0AAP0EJJ7_9MAGN